MSQVTIGDLLRDVGISKVTLNSVEFLAWAREVAYVLCLQQGSVTVDDVRKRAEVAHLWPHHPNAWGAVFRDTRFVACGRVKSGHAEGHAREVKQWRLK